MSYLILAILASFCISVLVKLNETRGVNTQVVIASNYITASALGWGLYFQAGPADISLPTFLLGLGGGILWPGGFYLLMWGIRRFGMSLAGTACRLSLSVPVLFALLFLNERLDTANSLGLIATFASLYLFSPIRRGQIRQVDLRSLLLLPVLALWFGVADLWVNLFNHWAPGDEKFLFLTLVFTFSLPFSWAVVVLQRIQPDREAVTKGLVLGIPNFLTSYFLLETLRSPTFFHQSAIAYTLFSVAGVSLAFGAGVLIWRETVSRSHFVGFLLALAAITLLNQ